MLKNSKNIWKYRNKEEIRKQLVSSNNEIEPEEKLMNNK